MISGIVAEGHAIVTVRFRISNRSGCPIDFVVDTGFTDELCLPPEAVALLGLRFRYAMPANLADNSQVTLPVHEAIILWNGLEQDWERGNCASHNHKFFSTTNFDELLNLLKS